MWRRALAGLSLALLAVPLTAQGQQAPGPIADLEVVELQAMGEVAATIKAYVKRPQQTPSGAKVPAVIAVHGCNGLFKKSGDLGDRERDWLARLNAAGYAVVYPDSFNPRGFPEVCTIPTKDRRIIPRQRAQDIAATLTWLRTQPGIDAGRIALIGWSHGGTTTLWSATRNFSVAAGLKVAIAFYPGCTALAASPTWAPGTQLTILIGAADDWTPVAPCRTLVARHPDVRMIEYPGAVHGFDAPNSPLRTRTGLGATPSGTAKIGTDPKARAASIDEVMRTLTAAFK